MAQDYVDMVRRGYEAFARRDLDAALAMMDSKIEDEEVFERDDEVVLFVHYTGSGRESGATVEARTAHVWTVRDGVAIRLRQYLDREEALAAAGLTQETA